MWVRACVCVCNATRVTLYHVADADAATVICIYMLVRVTLSSAGCASLSYLKIRHFNFPLYISTSVQPSATVRPDSTVPLGSEHLATVAPHSVKPCGEYVYLEPTTTGQSPHTPVATTCRCADKAAKHLTYAVWRPTCVGELVCADAGLLLLIRPT
jgi:hypothetical protein